jgi:DNA-binding transcriptional regulator YdaS (Cro superfamily)
MDIQNPTPLEKAIAIIGGTNATARALGIKPPSVSKWLRKGRAPAERCRDIEKLTKGKVTRYELRPDVFGAKVSTARKRTK